MARSEEHEEDLAVLVADPPAALLPAKAELHSAAEAEQRTQTLRLLLYCSARATERSGGIMHVRLRLHLEGRLCGYMLVVDEEVEPEVVWPQGPLEPGQPCLCWVKTQLPVGQMARLLDGEPAVLLLQLDLRPSSRPAAGSFASQQQQQQRHAKPPASGQAAATEPSGVFKQFISHQEHAQQCQNASAATASHASGRLGGPGNLVYLLLLPSSYMSEADELWAQMRQEVSTRQLSSPQGQAKHLDLVHEYVSSMQANNPAAAAAPAAAPAAAGGEPAGGAVSGDDSSQGLALLHQVLAWPHMCLLHLDMSHVLINLHCVKQAIADPHSGSHVCNAASVPAGADALLLFLSRQPVARSLHALIMGSVHELQRHTKQQHLLQQHHQKGEARAPAASGQPTRGKRSMAQHMSAAAAAVAAAATSHQQPLHVRAAQTTAAGGRAQGAAMAAAGLRLLANMLEPPISRAGELGGLVSARPSQRRSGVQGNSQLDTAPRSTDAEPPAGSRGSNSGGRDGAASPVARPRLEGSFLAQAKFLLSAMVHGFDAPEVEADYLQWQEREASRWDYIFFWFYAFLVVLLLVWNLPSLWLARGQTSTHGETDNPMGATDMNLLRMISAALLPIKLLAFSSVWLTGGELSANGINHNHGNHSSNNGNHSSNGDSPSQQQQQQHVLGNRTRLVALSFMLEAAWWLTQAGLLGRAAAHMAPLHVGLLYFESPLKALLVQAPFHQLWPLLLSCCCASLPIQCTSCPVPICLMRPASAALMVLMASSASDLTYRWKFSTQRS